MDENKLNELLKDLKQKKPSELQMQNWKRSVRKHASVSKPSYSIQWLQLVAACLIGFIVGGLIFSQTQRQDTWRDIAKNSDDFATIEYIFTKID